MYATTPVRDQRRTLRAFAGPLLIGAAILLALLGAGYATRPSTSATPFVRAPAQQGGAVPAGITKPAGPIVQPETDSVVTDPATVIIGPSKATKNGNQGNDKSCTGNTECGPGNPAIYPAP
jgi:hypothetical protein